MGVVDRFDSRAKLVLALSQDEAIRFNHDYIAPEHLLIGLLREGQGVAARALISVGLDLRKVRAAVESTMSRGADAAAPPAEVVLRPASRVVMELANSEATRLGHHDIGTGHLLLGLTLAEDTTVSGIIESLGVSTEGVRQAVETELNRPRTGSS